LRMRRIEISSAGPSDREEILEILEEIRKWLADSGIDQWPFPITTGWVQQRLERGEFRLAKIGSETVGVFRLLESDPGLWEENPGEALYIHSLAVRRRWKGHWIGRSILQWAEAYATGDNRAFLRLDCLAENTVLCRYYEQAGFSERGVKEIIIGDTVRRVRLFEKLCRPPISEPIGGCDNPPNSEPG
jgi:GNAT superfamily N-acetyltransferase